MMCFRLEELFIYAWDGVQVGRQTGGVSEDTLIHLVMIVLQLYQIVTWYEGKR